MKDIFEQVVGLSNRLRVAFGYGTFETWLQSIGLAPNYPSYLFLPVVLTFQFDIDTTSFLAKAVCECSFVESSVNDVVKALAKATWVAFKSFGFVACVLVLAKQSVPDTCFI